MGVRLPKGDLHLGDGIRGVVDYPAKICVKALKLVNTLRGTFSSTFELPVSLGDGSPTTHSILKPKDFLKDNCFPS